MKKVLLLAAALLMLQVDTASAWGRTGHDAIASGRMTPELMHMLANAYYSGLFETIRHEMPRDRAHIYVRQLRRFFVMGWADLLQIERA